MSTYMDCLSQSIDENHHMNVILENCLLFYPQLKTPNARFNKDNPTFEVQIRTQDRDVKKYWESLGLKVQTVDPDDGDLFYRTNLRKRKFKADGSLSAPPEVLDGNLEELDPMIVGNGSIGNVRIWLRDYTRPDGQKATSATLDGVQVTTLVKFVRKEGFDKPQFGQTEMTVIEPPEEDA
jgi:hypothetical protein